MKKSLYKVVLVIIVLVFFENRDVSGKTVIRLNQKEVTQIRAPRTWKHVSWKCSNKNVKIINRHGRVISVKGIRKGRSQITVTNKKNRREKSFYIKINNKKGKKNQSREQNMNQNAKKNINMTLESVIFDGNVLTVTVHVKNTGIQFVKMGAGAKLYRWNVERSEYVEINNEQIVPEIVRIVKKNQEQDMQFRYSSSMIQAGHYKICVEWSGDETDKQPGEYIGFDEIATLEFDV